MRLRSALPIVALWAAACQSPPRPVADPAAAKASLEAADRKYTEMATSKNLAAFTDFYAAEGSMYPPGEPTASGLDAMRAIGNAFISDPAFAGSFRPVAVEVSKDGTMGYTLNDAELTVTGPDHKPVTERLRDFHVWRKQADGSWKIVVDIWNPSPPAAAPTTK